MRLSGKRPVVTAIICSYNGNDRIQRAIRSVLNQTFRDLELIVVDDGSERSLAPEATRFQDCRLQFFRFEVNQGLHAARAFAVTRARGDFVALLDDDDYWLSEKIEKQMKLMAAHPKAGLICTGAIDIYPDGRRFTRYPPSAIITHRQEAVYECTIASSVLFRKSSYEAVGGFDGRLRRCGDWECWIRLSQHYEIRAIMEPLAVTCMRDKSLQRSGDVTAFAHDRFAVLKRHEDYLRSEGLWNQALSWQYHTVGVRLLAAKRFREARTWFAKAALKRPRIAFLVYYGMAWPPAAKLYPLARRWARVYKRLRRKGFIK